MVQGETIGVSDLEGPTGSDEHKIESLILVITFGAGAKSFCS